ncbi:hypothetical protein DFAR_2550006 [Desulfarculales bacterium]
MQAGSAKMSLPQKDGQEVLVDQRGESEVFVAVSFLHSSRALFQITARKDLICYLLPGDVFRDLVAKHQCFGRHYRFGLTHNLEAFSRGASLPQPVGGLDNVGLNTSLWCKAGWPKWLSRACSFACWPPRSRLSPYT